MATPRMTTRVQLTGPGHGVAWVGIASLGLLGLIAVMTGAPPPPTPPPLRSRVQTQGGGQ
jgi:hypothetical protein